MDCGKGICDVHGVSSVTVMKNNSTQIYPTGASFSLSELGNCTPPADIHRDIRAEIWEMINAADPVDETPPDAVTSLLELRKQARANKNFAESDRLRDEIAKLGWVVQDSKEGQQLNKSRTG